MVSMLYPTFIVFGYTLVFITKSRFANNYFEFINYIKHHKFLALVNPVAEEFLNGNCIKQLIQIVCDRI